MEEKDSKEINLEQTIRDLKNKEREYLNLLDIEKKRYDTLEKYFNSFENEIQKKLSDSQNKLNELIKENYDLRNQKLTNSDECSLKGIKSDYIFVKNKLNEYKNYIANCNNLINLNLDSNSFDQKLNSLSNSFEQLITNNFNDLNEYKEKENKYKNELDKVNFEITKLKVELKEFQQKFILLNKQLEDEKNKYSQLLSLFNQQKSLIQIQEEKLKLQLL